MEGGTKRQGSVRRRGVDGPTAHHMTSGANMEKCANTQLCFWSHILTSTNRGVCEEDEEEEEVCVRGISEWRAKGRHRRETCVRTGA